MKEPKEGIKFEIYLGANVSMDYKWKRLIALHYENINN